MLPAPSRPAPKGRVSLQGSVSKRPVRRPATSPSDMSKSWPLLRGSMEIYDTMYRRQRRNIQLRALFEEVYGAGGKSVGSAPEASGRPEATRYNGRPRAPSRALPILSPMPCPVKRNRGSEGGYEPEALYPGTARFILEVGDHYFPVDKGTGLEPHPGRDLDLAQIPAVALEHPKP